MNYKKYLHTSHWKNTKFLLHSTKRKCSLCRSKKNLNIHHKTYRRIGNENPNDLIMLCQECHYLYHKYSIHVPLAGKIIGRIRILLKQGYSKEMAIKIGTNKKLYKTSQESMKINSVQNNTNTNRDLCLC